jgi:hypothetical protein
MVIGSLKTLRDYRKDYRKGCPGYENGFKNKFFFFV